MKLRSGKHLVTLQGPPTPEKTASEAEESYTSCRSDIAPPSESCSSDTESGEYSDVSSESDEQVHVYYDPADNYNIDEIETDDETDDEDKPHHRVPGWVGDLESWLQHQFKEMDSGDIFLPCDPTCDLDAIFNTRAKFKSRTSSAVWSKVPVSTEGLDFSMLTINESDISQLTLSDEDDVYRDY